MTVLEAIRKSAEFLERKNIESARLNAELLLAHVVNLPRLKLYLNFERALSENEADTLRDLVKRRGSGEPLQRLTGSVSFCGHEIATPPGALIPRPETEILAEMGWSFLHRLDKPESWFIDYGVGSACLSIAIAKGAPKARGVAVDVSKAALEIAAANIARAAVPVEVMESDGFSQLNPELQKFDLIVSNPPYIPTAEIETLSPEVRIHDPREALDGGADGLEFYRRLAAEGAAWLVPGGKLMAEFGDGQETAIEKLFSARDWIVEEIRADYTARPRFITARPRTSGEPQHG
ncbi:MAG TPA: peptide chain release factor N(5)-glutamine methyltransferase [Methylomirabilota bacterium]|nr:peptide chain release factor N(5)-glutamine methyltransferase [Methylomirabilota bacterium]